MSLLDDLKALLRNHEPSIFDETTAFGPKFNRLLLDVRRLLVGLELSEKEGEALITEVRIRMRRPQQASELGPNRDARYRELHSFLVVGHRLPEWARWEADGISFKFRNNAGVEVWDYANFYQLLDDVISERIRRAYYAATNEAVRKTTPLSFEP